MKNRTSKLFQKNKKPTHPVTGLEDKGLVCLNMPLRKGTSGCGSTEVRQQQHFSTCLQQLGHNGRRALQKGGGTIPIGTAGVLFEPPLTTDIPKPHCVVQPQHHSSKRGGNQPRWTLKSCTYIWQTFLCICSARQDYQPTALRHPSGRAPGLWAPPCTALIDYQFLFL